MHDALHHLVAGTELHIYALLHKCCREADEADDREEEVQCRRLVHRLQEPAGQRAINNRWEQVLHKPVFKVLKFI